MSWEWLTGPRYPVLERVIVNCREGQTFRGVIWARKGGYLVLRDAAMLRPKGETVPLDGEVLVPEPSVEFIQVVRG